MISGCSGVGVTVTGGSTLFASLHPIIQKQAKISIKAKTSFFINISYKMSKDFVLIHTHLLEKVYPPPDTFCQDVKVCQRSFKTKKPPASFHSPVVFLCGHLRKSTNSQGISFYAVGVSSPAKASYQPQHSPLITIKTTHRPNLFYSIFYQNSWVSFC